MTVLFWTTWVSTNPRLLLLQVNMTKDEVHQTPKKMLGGAAARGKGRGKKVVEKTIDEEMGAATSRVKGKGRGKKIMKEEVGGWCRYCILL